MANPFSIFVKKNPNPNPNGVTNLDMTERQQQILNEKVKSYVLHRGPGGVEEILEWFERNKTFKIR